LADGLLRVILHGPPKLGDGLERLPFLHQDPAPQHTGLDEVALEAERRVGLAQRRRPVARPEMAERDHLMGDGLAGPLRQVATELLDRVGVLPERHPGVRLDETGEGVARIHPVRLGDDLQRFLRSLGAPAVLACAAG
jgi:hypothetical protein